MKYRKYLIEDPTGGGDDGVLVLPEWAEPHATLRVTAVEEPVEMAIDRHLDSKEIDSDTVGDLLADW